MSNWKVFASAIELFPHPNADRLALGKLGDYQVVVGRNEYKSGEIVVFAPKRSILPPDLAKLYVGPNGASYLGGPEANRVRSIRLRGELSEGVVLPSDWVGDKLDSLFNEHDAWEWQLGEDISGLLGIGCRVSLCLRSRHSIRTMWSSSASSSPTSSRTTSLR